MYKEKVVKRIIVIEIIGFLSVILILWLDELLDLPHWLFGALATPINYFESIFESIVILLLALITIFLTHSILKRLRLLEGLLPVCSFCKSIRHKDQWTPIEQYINQHSAVDFSHSICPECTKEHYPDIDIHE